MDSNDSLLEFLVFESFGMTYSELEKKGEKCKVRVCAEKAYFDLNRTLTLANKSVNTRDIRAKVYDGIVQDILGLVKGKPDSFDKRHATICGKICSIVLGDGTYVPRKEDEEAFYYGQAQKWLNMTLKYMMLLGFWEKLRPGGELHDSLHVPVDKFILKAACGKSDDNCSWQLALGVAGSDVAKEELQSKGIVGKRCAYVDGSSKAWSRWEKDQYDAFRKAIKSSERLKKKWGSPIDWESEAWVEQSKLERSSSEKAWWEFLVDGCNEKEQAAQ